MVKVDSFLRENGPEGGAYCKINNGNGEEIRKIISKYKELLYGYISITYNGNEILGEDFLTRLDDLWGPVVDIVVEFMKNNFASGPFADNNTEYTLKPADDQMVEFELSGHSYFLPKKEFLFETLNGAKEFYTHYIEATKTDYYIKNLEQIETYMEKL
jgi:hypothetical protein